MFNLNDKAIVLLGRRKVDRGLGFHYCPMVDDEKIIDYGDVPLITSNKDSLVWTDEILGSIKDAATAVQKAGRLAGIIAHSPQYSGNIHYWCDMETEQLVRTHNKMVDYMNENKGGSVIDAFTTAKERAEDELKLKYKKNTSTCKPKKDSVSNLEVFTNMVDLNKRWKEINPSANELKDPVPENGRYKCSIGSKSKEHTIKEIDDKVGGPSMVYWGEGFTSSKGGDIIHRLYVGYNDDKPEFALRWAIVKED